MRFSIKVLCVCVSAWLLSGCATAPSTSAINELASAKPSPLTAVVPKNDAPLLGAQPSQGELGEGDAVVVLKKGGVSYYRLYRLAPTNGVIRLKVTSYCACFGYDKRVAVPLVRVLTKAGQVIDPTGDGYVYEVEGAHGFTPLSVTLTAAVPGGQSAYVLVAADNSRPDAQVSHIDVVGLMQLGVSASPVGRFDIREVSP